MNRKAYYFLFIFTLIFSFFSSKTLNAQENLKVHFFTSPGCSHCSSIRNHLLELKQDFEFEIEEYDISNNENKDLFLKIVAIFKEKGSGKYREATPFLVLGGKAYIGDNPFVKMAIRKYIEKYTSEGWSVDIVELIKTDEEILESYFDFSNDEEIPIPFLGKINVKEVSIALVAVVLGLVDGFNPCAMWVLIFLISMLINQKDRKKMWILGGIFLFTSAIFYFLVMVAWLELVKLVVAKTWFQIAIGAFAIFAGGYNLFKFIKSLKSDVGCEIVKEDKKEKFFVKIKKIVMEQKYPLAILGIIALAVSVNVIELACSAGFPLLFSQILAINGISGISAIMYILLYVLFFLIDDLIVFSIAMFTLKITGISNKYSKYSHLIGGALMLIIGILLIFFPHIIMFNF